jgi:hypothetical protein
VLLSTLNNSISQTIDLLQFEPLVFPDYAIFSNCDCGYADLPKRLWLCLKARGSLQTFISLLFLFLNIIIKETNLQILSWIPSC